MPKSRKRAVAKKAKPSLASAQNSSSNLFAQQVQEALAQAGDRKCVLHLVSASHAQFPLHRRYSNSEWFELRGTLDMQSVVMGDTQFMTHFAAVPDGSMQAVVVARLIERLYAPQLPYFFKELRRVLADNGELLFSTPDAQMLASFIASGQSTNPISTAEQTPFSAMDLLFGRGTSFEQAHRSGWTALPLADLLQQAGFASIDITRRWLDLWCICYKNPANAQAPKVRIDQSHPLAHYPPQPPFFQFSHPGQFVAGLLSDDLDLPPNATFS